MKFLGLIVLLCAALGLAACGGDDDSTSDSTKAQQPATEVSEEQEPTIEVPKGPPPKKLVVRDIQVGKGAVVKGDDKLSVAYKAIFYKDGSEVESTWAGSAPKEIDLGGGVVIEGFKQGMEGMRVGGRREVIVPSRLANNGGDVIYVVSVLGIE